MVRGPYAVGIGRLEQDAAAHRFEARALEEHMVDAFGRVELRVQGAVGSAVLGAVQAAVAVVEAGAQRGQLRRIGAGVEVAGQQRRRAVGGLLDPGQQVLQLAFAQRTAGLRPVQVGDIEIDRAAVHVQAQASGRAAVVEPFQADLFACQDRAPGQQRVAVALRGAGRIDAGEVPRVAELLGQPLRLVGQGVVLQHFFQRDRVGVQFAQGLHDLGAPLRPVELVVIQVQRDHAERRGVLVGRGRRRGEGRPGQRERQAEES